MKAKETLTSDTYVTPEYNLRAEAALNLNLKWISHVTPLNPLKLSHNGATVDVGEHTGTALER